ncbi:YlcG family protein [Salmonella enterica subsp. enterica serovar Montevideo]|uniref:YlcG family protein n=2 Tax=Salmonella enterica I TaxID=59201 RepID=A0A630WYD5_SALDE|nr:YlcG family protein [Salmonella enterica]EAA8381469.1 YlcG family protein [Salmonella enterica subsp. enterica]EAB7446562.1 YlcG family protein [Salmonella enterica subsp. enterica serovar Derby]EAP3247669.1 YlcG family protein [Salmonella enterica subsp. enterica serovar Johannesburg]EBO8728794.1 YlcG family protein [Salmonella enterica subsp. enterica serovar Typhimurium]EBP4036113.1 YlcG family protein [Salmonella enterica subsp. salamae]EBW8763945.1 YlcG family protein [Salmonella ente
MKPELIEILRARWQRLRIYRRPGSVLVDYRILRNFVRIYQFTGFTQ